VDQLGPNALGEVLEPGRVGDCYLGLLLAPGPAGEPEAGTILIVAPATLLHPGIPQPAGSLVYQLLTGHPEREAGELVFVADLTGELRAWPTDTWPRSASTRAGRPGGHRLLAGRRGHRAAARRPQLRGGPLPCRGGDDLCPRAAPRPSDRPDRSCPPALAAPHQRSPIRRPVPVTNTRRRHETRSFRKQRTVNRRSLRLVTISLPVQGRPCGRPAAAAVLGRQDGGWLFLADLGPPRSSAVSNGRSPEPVSCATRGCQAAEHGFPS
jgi:hypothetical protein